MKKIIVLLTALTLIMSFPMVSMASEETEVFEDYQNKVRIRLYDINNQWHYTRHADLGKNHKISVNGTLNVYPEMVLEFRFGLYALLNSDQKRMLSLADTVTFTPMWSMDITPIETMSDYSYELLETSLEIGGTVYRDDYEGGTLHNDFPLISSSYFELGRALKGADNLDTFYYTIRLKLKPIVTNGYDWNNGVDYDLNVIVHSLYSRIELTGIDGGAVQIMLGIEDLQDSVNQGFSDVQNSINQGFDGVLKPDASDKQQSDKFGSEMSDKVQQGGQILDSMGEMQKPDIDSVMPDDLLSDNEADAMITLMDTVQPVLASALIGRTLLIGLILALIAFIFYGKR